MGLLIAGKYERVCIGLKLFTQRCYGDPLHYGADGRRGRRLTMCDMKLHNTPIL